MIRLLDLALLAGVSIWLGSRVLFLGMVIFSMGILFEFQIHRTRLLIGESERKMPLAGKIKAVISGLLLSAFLIPAMLEEENSVELKAGSLGEDWAMPVIVFIGLLSATLMVALTVERRQR